MVKNKEGKYKNRSDSVSCVSMPRGMTGTNDAKKQMPLTTITAFSFFTKQKKQ